MSDKPFVDHYETLQLSASADRETIERVFRLLAKRYHPDSASGDADLFNQVREAFEVLSDPEARAAYDARYDRERNEHWQVFQQEGAGGDRDDDRRLFHALLSLLYIARRRDPQNAGLAPLHLERMLGVPREHLNFPLWYLRKRSYVEVLENGLLAITVDGVDELGVGELSLPTDRLLADRSSGPREPEAAKGPARIADRTHPTADAVPLRATS